MSFNGKPPKEGGSGVLWGVTTMTFYHRPILEAVEFIGSCGFDCVRSGLITPGMKKEPAPPS